MVKEVIFTQEEMVVLGREFQADYNDPLSPNRAEVAKGLQNEPSRHGERPFNVWSTIVYGTRIESEIRDAGFGTGAHKTVWVAYPENDAKAVQLKLMLSSLK